MRSKLQWRDFTRLQFVAIYLAVAAVGALATWFAASVFEDSSGIALLWGASVTVSTLMMVFILDETARDPGAFQTTWGVGVGTIVGSLVLSLIITSFLHMRDQEYRAKDQENTVDRKQVMQTHDRHKRLETQ
jgi:membrane associated rhomboid family serine protease